MTNSEAKPLPVEPYAWRFLPVNVALQTACWWALLAWLLGGNEGAGNLFMAWTWFCAVVFALAAVTPPSAVLRRGAPAWVSVFFRCSALLQVGVLAWFGCWWLMAATIWTMLVVAAHRQRMDKQIAAQGVA